MPLQLPHIPLLTQIHSYMEPGAAALADTFFMPKSDPRLLEINQIPTERTKSLETWLFSWVSIVLIVGIKVIKLFLNRGLQWGHIGHSLTVVAVDWLVDNYRQLVVDYLCALVWFISAIFCTTFCLPAVHMGSI